MTLYRHFIERTASFGDSVTFQHALWDHRRCETIADIHALSAYFSAQGAKSGDVYTILMPTLAEGLLAFYALNRLGVRVNFVNPGLPDADLAKILDETHSKGIVLLDDLAPNLVSVIEDHRLPVLLCTYETYACEDKFTVPAHNDADRLFTKVACQRYGQVLADFARAPLPPEVADPKDVALYLQGGGTTGAARTIVLTNANVYSQIDASIRVFGLAENPGVDTTPNCMPLFHVYGLISGALESFVRGFKTIFLPKFDVDEFLQLMRLNRFVAINGVPNMYRKLMEHPKWDGPHLQTLRTLVTGGDNVPDVLRVRMDVILRKNGSPARIDQAYGMTETSCGSIVHTPGADEDPEALGAPLPGITVAIWDDEKRPVADGVTGEIAVSGPTVMRGYLNDEDTPDIGVYVDAQGRRWMLTGDLGYKKGRFVYFAGRKKRLIIISGYNAYPLDIEKVALSSGKVKEACAAQGFDEQGRILIRLFIVPADELSSESLVHLVPEICATCRQKLEEKSRPHDIRTLPALPRTHAGKVDFMRLTQKTPADPIYAVKT